MSSPLRPSRLAWLAGFTLRAAARLLSDPRVPDDPDELAAKDPVSSDEQLLRAIRPSQRPEFS